MEKKERTGTLDKNPEHVIACPSLIIAVTTNLVMICISNSPAKNLCGFLSHLCSIFRTNAAVVIVIYLWAPYCLDV